jgi:hypothetical protein
MNLIKIQEELKGFPTQTIMSYANGANPEVPPYMALAELSRRKTMEQRRAEPPTQSVKEKLESEIENPQGIAQLPEAQPAAPPQGVPQRPPQGPPGMPPGMPQGMPQGAPQGMPPGMPPRPPGMAAGGITRIPTRSDMFHYAPGGIVAFAGQDESLVQASENQERGDRYPPVLPIPAVATAASVSPQDLQGIAPLAAQQLRDELSGKFTPPEIQSKEEIRQAMIDKATAAGDTDKVKMLSQIPGDSLVPLITKLNAQNEEQRSGFKEGQGRMGLAALSNALIAAGEATRGQKGAGIGEAFGGFGKSYNAYTAEDVKRLEAQKAVERAQSIEVATLQSKIDDLRAAHATGTVQDQQEAQKRVQDQAYKMQAMKMGAADKILSHYLEQAKAETTKSHYAATEKQAENQLAQLKIHQAAQQKDWEDQRANRKKQLDVMERNAPSAEEKNMIRIEKILMNSNSDFSEKQKRLAAIPLVDIDSPQAQFLRDSLDAIRKAAYATYKLEAPVPINANLPKLSDYVKPEAEDPGFIKSIANALSSGSASPAKQFIYNPTTGERQVSNDGGKTWTPVGGGK